MFSAARFTGLASGFFRSLRSAFHPSAPRSASIECDSPPPGIDSSTLLPLLTRFQPSNVTDVLVVAAHYARMQRWDSVHAVYLQLDRALRLRHNYEAKESALVSASVDYLPLVACLTSDDCEGWLSVVRQCQRDASILQTKPVEFAHSFQRQRQQR